MPLRGHDDVLVGHPLAVQEGQMQVLGMGVRGHRADHGIHTAVLHSCVAVESMFKTMENTG